MKKWIHSIKEKLCLRNGETITESIVSILVFTLLMLAVTAMIQSALKITDTAMKAANAMQGEVNSIVSSVSGAPATVTFSNAAGINASHSVSLYNEDGLIAFDPVGEAGGP